MKKALVDIGYNQLSKIQEEVMPLIFDENDVLATADTGTGKTAAFMLPIINNILKEKERFKVRALVIAPTRELALQIHESTMSYCKYTNIRSLALFGGVKESFQKQKLHQGVDIVIATPGRLIDFIKQKVINLKSLNYFVLDEADRMLDMGFRFDVEMIMKNIPMNRQTMLFSATIPNEVKELSDSILNSPAIVSVEDDLVIENISQYIYYIDQEQKLYLLKDILRRELLGSVIVFCRTKQSAQSTANFLRGNNVVSDCIHKDKTQIERQKALNDFKNNKINVLVATDILSRGIDVDDLSAVINFDMPNDVQTYVHRIGRTARNNKNGLAMSFCSSNECVVATRIENELNILINEKTHRYKR